jgi:hypothetical protein
MTPWRDELAAAGGQLSLDHNDPKSPRNLGSMIRYR